MNVELINLTRSRSMEISEDIPADSNTIRMCASTRNAVQVRVSVDGEEQSWDEILEHEDASVDRSACRSLLLNHDPDNIIGTVRSITLDGMVSMVEAEILPGARLATGVSVMDAVRSGALRGVSIGYRYRMTPEDVEIDASNKRISVRKWRLLETTLTPIPADPAAGVRSLTIPGKVQSMDTPAPAPAPAVGPDISALRSEAKQVAVMARKLGLPADDFLHLSLADANGAMLEAISARDAAAGGKPAAPVVPRIEVGEEHNEKAAKRMVGAILHQAGFRADKRDVTFDDGSTLKSLQDGNELRGMTMTDMIRSTLSLVGEKTDKLNRHDLAAYALGKRDAANTSTGFFTGFVFNNIATKAVTVGFQADEQNYVYPILSARNVVPDYKAFAVGTLGLGLLEETVENAAFPELDKAEGSFQSQVKMWGGTLSLSEQAIVSDDTRQFMTNLGKAGMLAQNTIERQFFETLMGYSFSGVNVTASAGIGYTTADGIHAARTNLSKVESDLMSKLGTNAQPTLAALKYLLVPTPLFGQAKALMGPVAPGQQNNFVNELEVLRSPYLALSSITGNSATSYYGFADPNRATGIMLSTVAGIDTPRVEQYDPGAVAALKWKIYLPFKVDVVPHTINSVVTLAGIQKATA